LGRETPFDARLRNNNGNRERPRMPRRTNAKENTLGFPFAAPFAPVAAFAVAFVS
jgi:hypothetical protein